ncbi:MAG: hypothetical protein U0Z70_06305 [Thermomicrobiales bacterium]
MIGTGVRRSETGVLRMTMATEDQERVERWQEGVEGAPEVLTIERRRLLLVGTAAGFALAANGLLLPSSSQEAEARRGVYDGAKGGRRGKNRKGRDNRRPHDHKNNKRQNDAPRGGNGPVRSSALIVENWRQTWDVPLQCTFYYRIKTGLDEFGPPIANGTQTIEGKSEYRYDPDRVRVGVLIKKCLPKGEDIYADVRNVSLWLPRGGVTKGLNLDPEMGNLGDSIIPEQAFFGGDSKTAQDNVDLGRFDKDLFAPRVEWKLTVR